MEWFEVVLERLWRTKNGGFAKDILKKSVFEANEVKYTSHTRPSCPEDASQTSQGGPVKLQDAPRPFQDVSRIDLGTILTGILVDKSGSVGP